MTIGRRTVLLVCVLATSCSSPSESGSAIAADSEHWTSCIISGGIGNTFLSAETELADGRTQNPDSDRCSTIEAVHTSEELTVKDGRIREIRVNFSGNETHELDVIFSALHDRLVSLYGNSKPTTGYVSWKAPSNTGSLMEIELMDARALFQVDAIIVHWQEYEDRLYED
jgi:hypothetical protein